MKNDHHQQQEQEEDFKRFEMIDGKRRRRQEDEQGDPPSKCRLMTSDRFRCAAAGGNGMREGVLKELSMSSHTPREGDQRCCGIPTTSTQPDHHHERNNKYYYDYDYDDDDVSNDILQQPNLDDQLFSSSSSTDDRLLETSSPTTSGETTQLYHQLVRYPHCYILAPMVKIGVLPFRQLCLQYGADLVYSEELIARKVASSVRVLNSKLFAAQQPVVEYFIPPSTTRCTRELVFRTIPKIEKERLVLQLGAPDAISALKAAENILQDISVIDINMGCPKSFSVKTGMGAALLEKPEVAADIVKTLSRNLPCPISCKVRLQTDDMPKLKRTIEFCKACEMSGAAAIALHARERHERPSYKARWTAFEIIKGALNVPIIANGDFLSVQSVEAFKQQTDCHDLPIMIGRGAIWNPAIFIELTRSKLKSSGGDAPSRGEDDPSPLSSQLRIPQAINKKQVLCELIQKFVLAGSPFQSAKYVLQSVVAQDSDKALKALLQKSRSIRDLCSSTGMGEWYARYQQAEEDADHPRSVET